MRDENKKRNSETKALREVSVKTDCPCPKHNCKNFGLCIPCREKHKKSPPYCERKK